VKPFLLSPILLILGIAVTTAFFCQQKTVQHQPDPLDLSTIDTTVRPQDNFFLYANGTWLKHEKIPASQSAWGAIFTLHDKSLQEIHSILDSVSKLSNLAKGSIAQQTGDLYASAMDSAHIEQLGITPLTPYIERISEIKNTGDLLDEIISEYAIGVNPAFGFNVAPDEKNSRVNVAYFGQGGLGLPNRDYYFKQDSATQGIRKAFDQYITTVFKLTGDSVNAKRDADDVMKLETSLAKVSKSPVDLRDPIANYHKMTVAQLDKIAPAVKWNTLLRTMLIHQDTLIVRQPDFYAGLSKLLQTVPLSVWKNYLRFHLISNFAEDLSSGFVNAEFDFSKLLSGQTSMKERWKRMSAMVDEQLGDPLGQLYVNRFFPPEAKKRMLELVNNLEAAYAEDIENLDWMSDSTRQQALLKLHAIVNKIGYPDKWIDYSSVSISRDSLINNLLNCGHFEYMRDINKIGKSVDRSEWHMTPPTVDAYYSPTTNDINFPAGILQPPFFYLHGDDAVNYGAIGNVIGHEITHGFDDQGRHYDQNGDLRNWWTKEDETKFKQKANLIVNQYDHYYVLDSVHINGQLTLGENIADIGGSAIAYEAFQKTEEAKSKEKIDGFAPDQRYFLSTAQIMRVKYRPQTLRTMVMTNPHSPFEYRLIGPASDNQGFYDAFHVKPGDGMYRPDSIRVHIW
jgi:putative endopeptidase